MPLPTLLVRHLMLFAITHGVISGLNEEIDRKTLSYK